MAVMWKAALVFSAALLAAAETRQRVSAAVPLCSGFSQEQDHRDAPLTWRFRSCGSGEAREVQMQFTNRSDKPVAFEYRLWTHPPRNCKKTDEAPAAQGVRVLGANETEGWPYTVSTLAPKHEFNGRIWICVREVAR